jgi:hypothetical protein
MKLSREEVLFLRHWISDEAHYLSGVGPAKRLQVEHRVAPTDLSALIAAAIPDPAQQAEAASEPPSEVPSWPWSGETFRARLADARSVLSARK